MTFALRVRLRLGVYWDVHGFERACGIVEIVGLGREHERLLVIDTDTGLPILDPVEAIPINAS